MIKQYTRLMGFDFGLRRIGVATGQMITQTATPLCILLANTGMPIWPELDKLISTWQPEALVVGLPLNMDDTEQYISKCARTFGDLLKERYSLPVFMIDERLSSKEARAQISEQGGFSAKKKVRIDAFAAKLILETWMREYASDIIAPLESDETGIA